MVVDVVVAVAVAVAGVITVGHDHPLRGLRDGQPTPPPPRASRAPVATTFTTIRCLPSALLHGPCDVRDLLVG